VDVEKRAQACAEIELAIWMHYVHVSPCRSLGGGLWQLCLLLRE
jgi:hypothetical protein